MSERPFLSIIMPVYNRAAVVGRAIRSCLSQEYHSFEIVAVDDGSSDESAAAIRVFEDPRVRLIGHEKNRGRCPARNTAMSAARGQWFLFLDSDDELLPGALEVIDRRASSAGPEIGGLRFMCVDERGLSPIPAHHDEVMDYEAYLRWCNASIASDRQETLPCARATTFPAVRYADSHASEHSYHLELSRTTLVQACTDVVRRYHHDVRDRITIPTVSRGLRYAADEADDARFVLAVHGDAMLRFAPLMYRITVSSAAATSFMAGRKRDGLRFTVRALRRAPFWPRLYAVAIAGLLGGPRLVAQLRALRARFVRPGA